MVDVLRMSNVSVVRDGRAIVHDVNVTIEDWQRWVILGPNGAGKTTLARMASGRLYPSKGEVAILDEVLGRTDVSELHARVGLCSSALAQQITNVQSVADIVLSASWGAVGSWRHTYEDADAQRAVDVLSALGVGHLATRKWGTLSSGERKRVEVARALMPDPELLILDEPASGLDLSGREELVSALEEIVADPASPAMILITHHLEEIPAGFTHALALREGGVVAAGPIQEVITSGVMSDVFGLPLSVTVHDGRFTARAQRRSTDGIHAVNGKNS
ncbi:ABC transporter ATP-binding protein [Actinomyces vulturis]|uniref:ABC transporter ATP-binding protein n=1 Tax=Actinomyces vulturis TaxID=1857645 RepID=UPI0008330FCC|nr:ABC transporter ATP-binding protein [Actinomyces vulturis]